MVAGNRDCVPAGNLSLAVLEDVRNQPQRLRGRVDVSPAGDVFLEYVVLNGSGQRRPWDPVALTDQLVHQQERRCRCVDGHRRRDLVERDPVEEDLHVVDRVDRDPDLADFTVSQLVV